MAEYQQPQWRINWFTAAFDGECATCYTPFEAGEQVAYLEGDDRPSCEDCVDDSR